MDGETSSKAHSCRRNNLKGLTLLLVRFLVVVTALLVSVAVVAVYVDDVHLWL